MIAARTLKPAIKSISAFGVSCKLCFLLTSNKMAPVRHMAETMFSGVSFTFKL